jgi:hypothetical protein
MSWQSLWLANRLPTTTQPKDEGRLQLYHSTSLSLPHRLREQYRELVEVELERGQDLQLKF